MAIQGPRTGLIILAALAAASTAASASQVSRLRAPGPPEQALSLTWRQLGSGGGGTFQSIDFSPRPNAGGHFTVFLGGDTCGLFKSEDDGDSWVPVNNGLYDFRISKVVVKPDDPSVVFAATSGGLFKSVDAGRSWSPVDFGRPFSTSWRNNALASLALSPSDPEIVYVGSGNLSAWSPLHDNATEIHRSMDGGATWERVFQDAGHLVTSIAANPKKHQSVYAALAGPGEVGLLLHSTESGKARTWKVVDSKHAYYQLAFDHDNHLYATGKGLGSKRSVRPYVVLIPDSGDDVSESDIIDLAPQRGSKGPRSVHGLAVTPQGTVYVSDPESANPTIWRLQGGRWSAMLPYDSRNTGWADFKMFGRPWARARCLGVAPDGTPWHGGTMQVYRWGGGGWEQKYARRISPTRYLSRGNSNTVIFSRDMVFLGASEYYWGPADIYVEGTDNGGKDCVRIRFPDPGKRMNDVRVLTADRQDPHVWYVVTHLQDRKADHARLLKKEAGGTWRVILTSSRPGSSAPFGSPTISGGGVLDVTADGPRILVATYEDGVFRSIDGGRLWKKVQSLGKTMVAKFARSGLEPNRLMAAASGRGEGIWASGDDGATWVQIRPAAKPYYAVAWGGSATWYASEEDRILRSRDGGETWEAVYGWRRRADIFDNRSPDSNDISVGIVDPHDPDKNPVSAAFTVMGYFDHSCMGGLAVSLDGGAPGTWSQPDMAGVTYHGWGVEFNPFDPFELFYLTYGSGVYKTRLTVPVRPRAPK